MLRAAARGRVRSGTRRCRPALGGLTARSPGSLPRLSVSGWRLCGSVRSISHWRWGQDLGRVPRVERLMPQRVQLSFVRSRPSAPVEACLAAHLEVAQGKTGRHYRWTSPPAPRGRNISRFGIGSPSPAGNQGNALDTAFGEQRSCHRTRGEWRQQLIDLAYVLHCHFAAARRALAPLRVMVVSCNGLLARQKQHVANHLHSLHHLCCTALMMVHPNVPGAASGSPERRFRPSYRLKTVEQALGRATGQSSAVSGRGTNRRLRRENPGGAPAAPPAAAYFFQ